LNATLLHLKLKRIEMKIPLFKQIKTLLEMTLMIDRKFYLSEHVVALRFLLSECLALTAAILNFLNNIFFRIYVYTSHPLILDESVFTVLLVYFSVFSLFTNYYEEVGKLTLGCRISETYNLSFFP
jgi:hypothetical protein